MSAAVLFAQFFGFAGGEKEQEPARFRMHSPDVKMTSSFVVNEINRWYG
jgi:hypothetical protein